MSQNLRGQLPPGLLAGSATTISGMDCHPWFRPLPETGVLYNLCFPSWYSKINLRAFSIAKVATCFSIFSIQHVLCNSSLFSEDIVSFVPSSMESRPEILT